MKNKLDNGIITQEEYDHWRYHYPKDRDDADSHHGVYSLVDVQMKPESVREKTAVYSEDDVLEILKLYKQKQLRTED